jgi:flavin-dependent thymidylate synthase
VSLELPSAVPSSGAGFSLEPRVTLAAFFPNPYNNAVAAARTCYSPTVVTPEDVDRDAASRARRDAIAQSTYQAGHHTTLQHAHFQFVLENVSRQFIWSFLHSHPFYNSEQVSQRYVTVDPRHVTHPPLEGPAVSLFESTVADMMGAYAALIAILLPEVRREYAALFPLRNPDDKKWARTLQRKAQEVARYILPVATHAHLYHTISGLTLHRYHRLCRTGDAPWEQKVVVDKMVAAVAAVDPLFVQAMEDPLPLEETPEYAYAEPRSDLSREFAAEFDASLGGRVSKLVDYSVNGEKTLAQAVRSVLGVPASRMTDDDAIDRVLNPARNPYLSETLNLSAHAKLTRTLSHMHFTFRKKISHTADSQDQRHRMTPASRPLWAAQVSSASPDCVLPDLVRRAPRALELFNRTTAGVWKNMTALLDMGAPREFVNYLLPNAAAVRYEESGDLLNFHHKWTKRLCYTAQEEIWRASRDEVLQVARVAPRVARYLGAPCALRALAPRRPFCPEGDRFCGVLVWKKKVEEYERVL